MIELRNVSFSYTKKKVIKDITLKIERGERIAVVGPNGSGKSTLLYLIDNFFDNYTGSIMVDSREVRNYSKKDLARIISFVQQETYINMPFTSRDIILMGRYPSMGWFDVFMEEDIKAARKTLSYFRAENLFEKKITEISGGERQIVLFCRALMQECPVMLLDEAFSALDIKHQKEMLNIIERLNREMGVTIVSVMHDINMALNFFEKVLLLKDGRVYAFGNTEEIADLESLSGLYETDINVVHIGEYDRRYVYF